MYTEVEIHKNRCSKRTLAGDLWTQTHLDGVVLCPVEYGYLYHFLLARPDLPKILYEMSKNHPKWLFLASVIAEVNKQFQCDACVKFFLSNIFTAYIQFETLYTYIRKSFFKDLLEPIHMKVFSLKLQYQKVISVKANEFHMMWNSIMRSIL